MTKPPDEATEWLYFAGEDLRASSLLCKEGIYGLACLHAQQCAEKCLKAYIVHRKYRIKKIHDLNELLEICLAAGGNELKQFDEELSVLNMFYAPMRYPAGIPGSLADRLPGKKDSEQAIYAAEKIYSCMMDLISGFKPRKKK